MEKHVLAKAAARAIAANIIVWAPSASVAKTPPMAGGYTDFISIPVDDPNVKAIAGAFFKPPGTGPFPAIVYMSGCGGLAAGAEQTQEKSVIDHMTAKGVATLIVDPFSPRGETDGVCAKVTPETARAYFGRGGKDAVAAINFLKAMPDIDPKVTPKNFRSNCLRAR